MAILIIIIGLSLLIIGHEIGHFVAARLSKINVEEFGFGLPPHIWKKRIGKTDWSINWLPFGGFVKMWGEDGEEEEEKKKQEEVSKTGEVSFPHAKKSKRAFVLSAGVLMNFLLGWILLSLVYMVGVPGRLMVLDVASDSPASVAGLMKDDVITSVQVDDVMLEEPIHTNDFGSLVKSAKNEEIKLGILRGQENISIITHGRENPPEGQGSLGISFTATSVESAPFFMSFLMGAQAVWSTCVGVLQAVWGLIASIWERTPVLENMSGPVGIVAYASGSESLGIIYMLQILGIISVNLAIMNLLPFPALDGGRLIFLLAEKIKGSPVSKKVQVWVNAGGFFILIGLMIVITIKDIYSLF